MSDEVFSLYNGMKVNDQIITSGHPTKEQLESLAADGVINVINLAPYESERGLENEPTIVQSLGMNYIHIPVIWKEPKESDFEAFEKALSEIQTQKTLIHCAANFRVSAFYSLYAQKHLGWTASQADEFRGKIWTGSDYPIWEAFITKMKATFS